MKRYYYRESIIKFLQADTTDMLGQLAEENEFALEQSQRDAWLRQISILKSSLKNLDGSIFFEYAIPRMGKRIDVLLVIGGIIIILEFKVGANQYLSTDVDQVWDYALDLKNFHETSHNVPIIPVLVATDAKSVHLNIVTTPQNDGLFFPVKTNSEMVVELLQKASFYQDETNIDVTEWLNGKYKPTPTIIEAAIALYNNHSVADISKGDADAINLSKTNRIVSEIINDAKLNHKKAICFVTGVPGAGKTLVGLDIATKHIDKGGSSAVFLSGNGPLVAILREALTRDKVKREREKGNKIRKNDAEREVKMFIQNVHHFRDECLIHEERPPFDHVAIFDEAQRAWNHVQTADFMRRKKGRPNFGFSEPEFLISCLNRHSDWAVIVCLVGGGQEINTGEGGIAEWINSLNRSFPDWNIFISSQLHDTEYAAGEALNLLNERNNFYIKNDLHLSVSMRSFRAEYLSSFVKAALDLDIQEAKTHLDSIHVNYPIILTRCLLKAKRWLREKARGSERYGLIVSSQAQRLKPYAIDVRYQIDPIQWFLNGKEDVRSSYYLEDVATEFHVQGLELDWACVTWDADFRYGQSNWNTFSFRGNKWQRILNEERKKYLKNAYRVLLTRARQGMIIVVPEGDAEDPTRSPEFYNDTYSYLASLGLELL